MAGTKRVFKGGKKLTGTPGIFRKWSDWEVGDVVVGEYKETYISAKYKKPVWVIKVEDAMFADKKFAKTLIGQDFHLNSNGKIDKAMEKCDEGTVVQITYNGKSELPKGHQYAGADSHDIEVIAEGDVEDESEDLEDTDDEGADDSDEDSEEDYF